MPFAVFAGSPTSRGVSSHYIQPAAITHVRECCFPTLLRSYVKPAIGRHYVRAFSLSGTVPAFTCDCLRFVCAFTRRRKFDLCVSTSSRTMLAFGNNVSCSSSECSTTGGSALRLYTRMPNTRRNVCILLSCKQITLNSELCDLSR